MSVGKREIGMEGMNVGLHGMKPKYRQSYYLGERREMGESLIRTRERGSRENLNDILIRKCKDLNQSLYL